MAKAGRLKPTRQDRPLPLTYQITAVRSTSRGNPAQYTVNFGTGAGGGLAIASITQGEVEFDGEDGLRQAA